MTPAEKATHQLGEDFIICFKIMGKVIKITFSHYAQGYVLDDFVNSVVKCGLFCGV